MRRTRFDFSYLVSAGALLAGAVTLLTGLIADVWDLNQFTIHSYAGYLAAGLVSIHVLLVGGRLVRYAAWRLGRRGRRPRQALQSLSEPALHPDLPRPDTGEPARSFSAARPMTRRDFLQFLAGGAAGLAASPLWRREALSRPAGGDMGEAYHAWSKPGMASLVGALTGWGTQPSPYKHFPEAPRIHLPAPKLSDPQLSGSQLSGSQPANALPVTTLTVEEAIATRRSVRAYQDSPMAIEELSRLLYLTGGITGGRSGYSMRAAPSAGALYPIETYAVVHRVEGLEPGLYHYGVEDHGLSQIRLGDLRGQITRHGLMQEFLGQANLVLVFTAIFQRLRWRYQSRAYRYALLEAGHLGQNVYLAAAALGFGACAVGAFLDDDLNAMLGVDGVEEAALYLLAVGKEKRG